MEIVLSTIYFLFSSFSQVQVSSILSEIVLTGFVTWIVSFIAGVFFQFKKTQEYIKDFTQDWRDYKAEVQIRFEKIEHDFKFNIDHISNEMVFVSEKLENLERQISVNYDMVKNIQELYIEVQGQVTQLTGLILKVKRSME